MPGLIQGLGVKSEGGTQGELCVFLRFNPRVPGEDADCFA